MSAPNVTILRPPDASLRWTEIPNKTGREINRRDGSWPELLERLRTVGKFKDKGSCPWIKMAVFGDHVSAGGSLRNNRNVIEVTGVEGDYDRGEMPPEVAILRLQAAGLRGAVYPSPSSTPARPRWRVLCPLSKAAPPADRARLLARVNGALGGVLSDESFTLSQSYFFGDLGTNDYGVFITFDDPDAGTCVDVLEGLDAGAVFKAGSRATPEPQHNWDTEPIEVEDGVIEDLRSALAALSPDDRSSWIARGMALKALGDEGFRLWDTWSRDKDTCGKYDLDAVRNTWETFEPTATSYKAVFSAAAEAGWKNTGIMVPADASDFDQLDPVELTDEAYELAGLPKPLPAAEGLTRYLVDLTADEDPFAPLPYVVEKWVPMDEVTLLAAHGGSGKSYVALSLAIHIVLGRAFAGQDVKRGKVLFFSAEDGGRVLRQRVARLCSALDVPVAALEGKLLLLDASDLDTALHRDQRTPTKGAPYQTPLLDALVKIVEAEDVLLTIVDNASDTYDDDEIKKARVRTFVRTLRSRLGRPGRAVLLLAHVNKASAGSNRTGGTEDYSGSAAWHNSVRSRLSMAPTSKDAIMIEHLKANNGVKADPVTMDWRHNVPLVSGTYGEDIVSAEAAAEAMKKDEGDMALIVLAIQRLSRIGDVVPTATQGQMPCHRVLSTSPDFPVGTSADRLTVLLRKLQEAGRIRREVTTTANRKSKEIYVVCS